MSNMLEGMFEQPQQQPNMRQRIGRTLQAFGAGYRGKGAEFGEMMMAQQQQLDEQRKKAMAQDAFTVYGLLNDNKVDDALSLIDRRVQYINELGGDPSDTLELRQMIMTPGRLNEARQELGSFVTAAMENGYLAAPAQPEEFTLSPGQQRFRGDQVIAQVDAAPTRQYRMLDPQEVRQYGLDPERSYQINEETRQVTAVGGGPAAIQTVNMPTPESKATEEFGKGQGERANQRIEQALNAQSQNQTLMRMSEAIAQGAQTGLGQETLLNVKNLAQSLFGIQLDENVGEQEVIRALGNRLAMEVRNPASGLGLTGATSNRDLDFLTASIPNLQKTPQGNALLLEYLMKQNEFKMDVANHQQQIIDENGGSVPRNIDTQLMSFVNSYRFLDDDFKSAVDNAVRMADQPQPSASRFQIQVIQ